jgi:hypothetical protein
MRLIPNAIKQKLDPKAPIFSKWVENISFWHHVILDTSTHLLADLLSMLGEEEIDLNNPEVMVKNMVSKFKVLKAKALRAGELEAKHKSEVEALRRRIADLEEAQRLDIILKTAKGKLSELVDFNRLKEIVEKLLKH